MMVERYELKSAADAAFKEGRLEEAESLYGQLVALDPSNAAALCNHSAAALKCGQAELALQSAEQALRLLPPPLSGSEDDEEPAACHPLLPKALHRKAQALVGLGSVVAAIRVYRSALGVCVGAEEELLGALRITADQLPPSWLAKYWARLVEEAEAPNPLSSRDGRLLRTIPPERRLAPEALRATLEEVLQEEGWQAEARDLMCAAWGRGRRPGRAEAAFFRAAAYLRAGNPQLALRDARVALVYGPQAAVPAPTSCDQALVVAAHKGGKGGAAPAAGPVTVEVPCWPAALALQGAVLEALGDNIPAALSVCKALELDPENEAYSAALQTLLRRIPEELARVLQERGTAGLEAALAAEREQRLPEFLRKRPKYYYYYEWMRKRINEQYPSLPEPVMDKLLTIEANELDLILQYPQATQQTVERVLGVYEEQGPEFLETYRVPLLSWEEVKTLKGPDTVGLPLGSEAFGGLLEGLGMGGNQQQKPPALPPPQAPPAAQLGGTGSAPSVPGSLPAPSSEGGGQCEDEQHSAPAALLQTRKQVRFDLAADAGFAAYDDNEDDGSEGSASVEEFGDLYELD